MVLKIPDIDRLVETLVWVIIALAAVVVFFLLYGCALDTQVMRHIAEGAARDAARAAVDGVADRLGVPEPTEAVSPLQGMFGAVGVMAAYLIRKKWFPMGKR